jgi:hypothetical protein
MNPGIVNIRRKFGKRYAYNPTRWDKWGICQELPPHRQGIHPRKGIPPGITNSYTWIQAGKIKIRGKSFER